MLSNLVDFLTDGESIVMVILSIFVISGAVFMINFTKVVHMVLSLATTFIGLAGLYIVLGAEFIGFVQILVYGGAITILMLFGIMMTKHDGEEEPPKRPLHNVLIFIGVLALFGTLYFSIQWADFPVAETTAVQDNTKALGESLFNEYVFPMELVAVLLVVAFIGAIALAKREED